MILQTEDTIEKFIRENKDKFGVYSPTESHMEKFLFRLNFSLRHIISIVPYLIKVAVATILIFAASLIIWNNFIRKDRYQIPLGHKISLVINKITSH